ncbi:MauE/DoxX family redox-associated membrane protein [Actinomadura rudentiformis]|uniref:Methylamine utilisation protein MauE domain-containing protein n=1 Tax=Actinomadura rudentiformis TaxID=359158 RepID=A0A6H9Y8D3_9ACTN|nr:MauE/DoxX family redox-associated membrane protein [Actinomadura rudentiformis]KAB2340348.1 hypothetical protein F8566_44970 [Actinomadura rudentiformis]
MAFLDVSIRVALAVTFLVASVSKVHRIEAWRSFRNVIEATGLVPPRIALGVGALVIAAEFAVASLLLIPYGTTYGFIACILLLVAFSGMIARAIRRNDQASCQCFGSSVEPVGAAHLYRNTILLVLAASGLAISPSGQHAADAAVLMISVPVGIFWALVLMHLGELLSLIRFTQRADGR